MPPSTTGAEVEVNESLGRGGDADEGAGVGNMVERSDLGVEVVCLYFLFLLFLARFARTTRLSSFPR